ncbi:MAG: ZPR1 zinc finger domain-containing protein, partial [Candidatus Aenigmarchaeota archaeon]|nr:ZPR1 zinc finger domain-containing protein [Candidatus Aenigmarchaeota archaeon]
MKRKNKLFHSFIISCPVCGRKSFRILQKEDLIPHFGEVLETFAHCEKCGYKTTDILPLEVHPPTNQKIKIDKKEVLEFRVVKSKFGEIKIPELGIHISPGPGSEGYITNVEGILDRIVNFLEGLKVIKEKDKKKIE